MNSLNGCPYIRFSSLVSALLASDLSPFLRARSDVVRLVIQRVWLHHIKTYEQDSSFVGQ
jgi:hypothetical protein